MSRRSNLFFPFPSTVEIAPPVRILRYMFAVTLSGISTAVSPHGPLPSGTSLAPPEEPGQEPRNHGNSNLIPREPREGTHVSPQPPIDRKGYILTVLEERYVLLTIAEGCKRHVEFDGAIPPLSGAPSPASPGPPLSSRPFFSGSSASVSSRQNRRASGCRDQRG